MYSDNADSALRWRLSGDSIVVDLMKSAPKVVRNAIHAAQNRSIRPYWRSTTNGNGPSQWHYNHSACAEKIGKGLVAGSAAGTTRKSAASVLELPDYADWKSIWNVVREATNAPEECDLLRVYQNVYPFGADAKVHMDSREPDEVTACIYLHSFWDRDWGGETVVFDPNDEIRRAVLPTPGRLFAFRSVVPHVGRPVARAAMPLRCVLVMKMGPWPIEQRIGYKAVDAIISAEVHGGATVGVKPNFDPKYAVGQMADHE